MAELKEIIKMANLDLTIRYGGEDMTIFDIMCSYRNDGSCEAIIRQALVLLVGREDGDNAHILPTFINSVPVIPNMYKKWH